MNLDERADNYSKAFPDYPPLCVSGGWLYGIWMIGQDYRSRHGYHGEYPPSYLRRIHSLFPEAQRVLHLFSGAVEKGLWPREWTLDRRPGLQPDLCLDVSDPGWVATTVEYMGGPADLVLADPPYTEEDAEKYGTCLINRNVVVRACTEVVRPGGHLVWLDQVLPMFRKADWHMVGTIGLWRSTNHRFRGITIWART